MRNEGVVTARQGPEVSKTLATGPSIGRSPIEIGVPNPADARRLGKGGWHPTGFGTIPPVMTAGGECVVGYELLSKRSPGGTEQSMPTLAMASSAD